LGGCAEGAIEEQAGKVRGLKESQGLGNEDVAVKVNLVFIFT